MGSRRVRALKELGHIDLHEVSQKKMYKYMTIFLVCKINNHRGEKRHLKDIEKNIKTSLQ